MYNSYSSFCDDFYFDMQLNTELDLPSERDTILTFFERIRKQFPGLGNLSRSQTGDYSLEEEHEGSRYRWVTLEPDRIVSGCANPRDLEDAFSLHRLVLELSPYMLGISRLDIDSLDVTLTMDFDYQGNQDEIIAEALFSSSPFGRLLELPHSKPIGFSPNVIIALSDDCRTQARIAIESRTSAYDIKSNKFKPDEPISLYFTIRRYPSPDEQFNLQESYAQQCRLAAQLMAEQIIPYFVTPLTSAIAQRR